MTWRTTVIRAVFGTIALVVCPDSPVRAQSAECVFQPCTPAASALSVDEMWAAAAGAHQLKLQFVAALRDFTRAQAGVIGDEAAALRTSLEAMRRTLGRWDRAIVEFETAVAVIRRTDEVHVALATVYLDRHRPKDALRELAAAARLNGSRLDVYSLQAHAHTLAGNAADAAAAALQRAAAIEPAHPVVLYWLSQQWTRLGRGDEAAQALAQFSAAVAAAPIRAGTSADLFERVDLLRQVAGVAPLFPVGLYSDGYAELARGDYRAAISRLVRAAGEDPLSRGAARARSLMTEAGAELRRSDIAAALDLLRRAVDAAPADAEAHRMLALAFSLDGQAERSVQHLTTAVRLDPRNERARISLADALLAAGRADEAEQQLQSVVTQFPRSGSARFRLGELYQSQARYPEAVAAFEASQASGAVVGRDQLHQTIGSIYVNQADFDRAVSAYAARVEVNPNSAEAHRRLAEIYFLQGRDVEALAEFLATALLDPSEPRAFAGAGQVQLRMKRYAQAADALARAVALGSGDVETRYALGTAFIRLGREEEGKAQIAASQRLQAEQIAAGQRDFELQALRRRGLRDLAEGNHADAVAALERAIEAQAIEQSADLHHDMAAAYAALGKVDDAARHRAAAARFATELRERRIRDLVGAP